MSQLTFELGGRDTRIELGEGAAVLGGFARAQAASLLEAIEGVAARAAFRHLVTPGGQPMSVAMTNCGTQGWTSSPAGYRYTAHDPDTGLAWPAMPSRFASLAAEAAAELGFDGYEPDACLINRYAVGARLTAHRDNDEADARAPIVSVSLGLPATFFFGGRSRSEPTTKVRLEHGDVVVWGGASRLNYHGVLPIRDGWHSDTGAHRYNLTFRRTR